MKISRTLLGMALAAMSLSLHAADPRPHLLILGESSSLPVRGELPWTSVVTREHPEWRITNLSEWGSLAGENLEVPHKKKTKTLPGWVSILDSKLKETDHADVVVVMLGLNHSKKEILEKISTEQAGEDLQTLLKNGKAHPKTQKATWVVVTPLPIVPSRLDQWSKTSFADSVEPNQQLAAAWKKAAEAEGAKLIDAHSRTLTQGKQGDAVMTAGWMVRWNGVGTLGNWMNTQLEAINPQPRDPVGFAEWQKIQDAHAVLDHILESTGGGRPAIATGLSQLETPQAPVEEGKKKKKKKNNPPMRFEVPVSEIEPGLLSILVEADGPHLATMGTGSDSYARPSVEITLTSGEKKSIPHEGTDWQYISELSKEQPVSDRRFGVSIGKWRPMVLVDGRPGQVRHAVLRWSLPLLKAEEISSITVVVPKNERKGYFQEEFGGKANALKSPGDYGDVRISLLARPDSHWDSSVATWSSRDGKHNWTGGEINATMREKEIRDFLKTNPPAEVRTRAESLMP